ncbi:MAG: glycan-binding surface protein [Prevotellaceae bacterium]|jgi:hypothetical protein|nr:glycan-binding surface protein [Prevotellaceae bacterium]
MKNFKFIIISILAMFFVACQDDIVTWNKNLTDTSTPDGPPEITKIILAGDTAANPTEITSANMGDVIIIYGKNLCQISSITFNGLEVNYRDWYAAKEFVSVPIPRSLLEESQVTNKVVITTSKGTVSHDLQVAAPRLLINGLYNEFAAPGETVQVLGDNFDLYAVGKNAAGENDFLNGDVSLDGDPIEIISVTRNIITLKIPENTADGAVFEVSSEVYRSHGGTEPAKFAFRELGTLMMTEYDNWGSDDFSGDGTKAGDPAPLYGISWYVRVAGTFPGDGWYWIFGGGANITDADVAANPQNYDLKFEFLTAAGKPFGVGNLEFTIAQGERNSWAAGAGGAMALETGGNWKTMTFDFQSFFDTSKVHTGATAYNEFAIAYQVAAPEEINVDFCIANARIVKKMN